MTETGEGKEMSMKELYQEQVNQVKGLSLEQLNQIKQQQEQDIQALNSNFAQLREAQNRFQESIVVVDTLGHKAEGKDVLVPLTQSLYVPGRIVEANKMLVDVGTGYFVEKDQRKTKELLERKMAVVVQNLGSLRATIDVRKVGLDAVVSVMRDKLADMENRRAELRAGAGGGAGMPGA